MYMQGYMYILDIPPSPFWDIEAAKNVCIKNRKDYIYPRVPSSSKMLSCMRYGIEKCNVSNAFENYLMI